MIISDLWRQLQISWRPAALEDSVLPAGGDQHPPTRPIRPPPTQILGIGQVVQHHQPPPISRSQPGQNRSARCSGSSPSGRSATSPPAAAYPASTALLHRRRSRRADWPLKVHYLYQTAGTSSANATATRSWTGASTASSYGPRRRFCTKACPAVTTLALASLFNPHIGRSRLFSCPWSASIRCSRTSRCGATPPAPTRRAPPGTPRPCR